VLREVAPGVTLDDVRQATGAPMIVDPRIEGGKRG
jgi:acyl CoA:acetate/3-ketoacid CoA transferase beta subunit